MIVPPRTKQVATSLIDCRSRMEVLRREGCPEDSPVFQGELDIEKRRCASLCAALESEKGAVPSMPELLLAVRDGLGAQASMEDTEAAALAAIVLEGLSANLGAG